MNQQLYNQFLDAASVMVGAQKFDEAITRKTDEWTDVGTKLLEARDKGKNAHKSYGKWTGWGIFFVIFGLGNAALFIFSSVAVFLEFIISGQYFDIMELIPFLFIIGLFIVMGFFGIYLITAAKIKRKKYVKKATKESEIAQAEIQVVLDKIEDEIDQLKARLRQFADENEHLIQFLPSCYRNPQAIGFMLKAIENLRADTLTDVINLYEQELHFLEQRQILENNAEMQRIHNENMLYAMDSINRNQERMNSNLQFIQAMQFINMLDD